MPFFRYSGHTGLSRSINGCCIVPREGMPVPWWEQEIPNFSGSSWHWLAGWQGNPHPSTVSTGTGAMQGWPPSSEFTTCRSAEAVSPIWRDHGCPASSWNISQIHSLGRRTDLAPLAQKQIGSQCKWGKAGMILHPLQKGLQDFYRTFITFLGSTKSVR